MLQAETSPSASFLIVFIKLVGEGGEAGGGATGLEQDRCASVASSARCEQAGTGRGQCCPTPPPPPPPHRLFLPVQSLSQQPSHHPHQPRAVRTRLQPQDSQPQSPAQKCSRRRPRAARHQARRSRSSTTLHGQATSSRCCWHPWPDGWVRRRSRARTLLLLLPARAAKTMVGRPWRPLLVVVVVPVVARWAQGRL